jgi:hypothetical protein
VNTGRQQSVSGISGMCRPYRCTDPKGYAVIRKVNTSELENQPNLLNALELRI